IDGMNRLDKIVKSNDHFFIVWKNTNEKYQSARVDLSGNVTLLKEFDYSGSYAHYKNDLVVGFSDPNNNDLGSVYRISENSVTALGKPGFTKEPTAVFVGSDGTNLFGAIANCISPLYIEKIDFPNATRQVCGWEIIKFQP
ncbi:MAG: hypothetical protein KDC92_07805, partial [Bacteroidetes bacterium]|nr:hypothetical protein [Bacteroidota bacterium]